MIMGLLEISAIRPRGRRFPDSGTPGPSDRCLRSSWRILGVFVDLSCLEVVPRRTRSSGGCDELHEGWCHGNGFYWVYVTKK